MLARLAAPVFCLLLFAGAPAAAQTIPGPPGAGDAPRTAVAQPQTSDQPAQANPGALPSIQSSLGPYGDPGGVRSFLSSAGVEYSLTYIAEGLGGVDGGLRRGAVYQGRLDLQVDVNLETLLGLKGATLHANAYQIHGRGLSRTVVGNLLTASGIEALPSTRLYELWLEQAFADGKASLRVGQLAADTEFIVSQTAGLFVNSTFGWPAITAFDLPNGGPAYPLATPGVRLKIAPSEAFSVLIGLFNGDPAGAPDPLGVRPLDPQRRNVNGLKFRLGDPPLLIGEAAYAYGLDKGAAALPGTVKIGAWRHFGTFVDQRFDALGLSLADPASLGVALRHRGDAGVYGVLDQTIYREPGGGDQGASLFARASASPSDRNFINFYVDGGLSYKGLFAGRPNDTAGFSVAYARVSDRVAGLDVDALAFAGAPGFVRRGETVIEATYQASVVPGFTIQPDLQYVIRPGGGVADPFNPGARLRNALIVGARATIRY